MDSTGKSISRWPIEMTLIQKLEIADRSHTSISEPGKILKREKPLLSPEVVVSME